MTIEFEVGVLATEVLERVAGAWQPVQFRQMLDELDYGDTTGLSDEELRELSLMSLQDLEPHSAAEVVLRARFGDRLWSGQIRNCAHEMLDEKLWEQYAEMSFHEDFFHVGSLLWEAFPRDFPTPDAARVAVEVTPLDAPGRKLLDRPLAEPIIVRLLADGMPPTAVLHRLFGDQIAGGPFSEAEFIVWEFQQTPIHDSAVRLDVLGSGYWLDSLPGVKHYVSRHSAARSASAESTRT